MSRRKRLTWQQRNADPYTMNQDKMNPPVEDYMTGEPSSWAEEPVEDLSRFEQEGRNELSMPAMLDNTHDHKDVDEAMDGQPYDNAGSFKPTDTNGVSDGPTNPRQAAQRAAQMQRYAEKKALQCVRIAGLLLPTASDDVITEQALDFMSMPDDALVATILRLAEAEELSRIAEEDEEEHDESDKDASLTPDQMLRQMQAEAKSAKKAEDEDEDEDEDEESDKESSIADLVQKEVQAALKAAGLKSAEDHEDEDESDKDASTVTAGDDEEEEEEESKEASLADIIRTEVQAALKAAGLKAAGDDEDEDEDDSDKEASLDSMLAELNALERDGMQHDSLVYSEDDEEDMEHDSCGDEWTPVGGDSMHDGMEMEDDLDAMLTGMEEEAMGMGMGLDLMPAMDTFDDDAMMAGDEDLEAMMSRQYSTQPAGQRQASTKKNIQSLGQVKASSAQGGGDVLSNLWTSAPDVSDAFSKGEF